MKRTFVVGLGMGIIAAASFGQTPAAAGETKVFPLAEISSVFEVKVSAERIYVSDARDRNVVMYALDGAKFLGKFGRAGQGPGEFDSAPRLVFAPEGLAAKSFSKILFFSPGGEFLREVKGFNIDLMVSGLPVFPMGERNVGFPFIRDESGPMIECVGRVYDADWKPVRDFTGRFPSATPAPPPPPGAKRTGPKQDALLVKDYVGAAVEGGRIYFADSRKGISIAVYDGEGIQLSEIKVEAKPVSVTRNEREKMISEWREEMKDYLDLFNPVVPDVYPAFFAFRLDGNEIYVLTPVRRDGRYEVIALDTAGKVLRRSFAFAHEPTWGYLPGVNSRFDIRGGKLYYVDYNEAAERYELQVTAMK
ncbi:MAG: hypothetical protein FJY80_06330 [Candidatus Aminicenantes bacterium]|nr:hypothetical protein [Candidatus Aminicenantes bacterium]